MQEFVDFLGKQAPYDALDADDLERLARRVEVEYFPQGATIVAADAERLEQMMVVRTGLVHLLNRGRIVDELGPGDTFGQLSVLSGIAPSMTAVAASDTLVYLLPDPRSVLDQPERLVFTREAPNARSLLSGAADYGLRPVSEFLRPLLWAAPDQPIRDAARAMTEARQSCVVVDLGGALEAGLGNGLGIVTDSDCRRLVATGEVPIDAPVSTILTSPVRTIEASDPAATAFLTMVQHGVHHLVATGEDGRPVGVCRVVDLSSSDIRDPLALRGAIDAADTVEELATAAAAIRPAVVEMYDAGVPPLRIGALTAALIESVVEKCIGWTDPFAGRSDEFGWLLLGSLARREPLPASDVDTALVWRAPSYADRPDELREAAGQVLELVEQCGLERCPDGANADGPLFNRPIEVWVERARHWEEHSDGPGALLLASMLTDSRPITGLKLGRELADRVRSTPENPLFRKRMLAEALARKPPVGFVKEFVVESGGKHRGELDLKRYGLAPVVALGRWIGICTAAPIGSTPARLALGEEAELLTRDEAQQLRHAFEEMYELLFAAEAEAIRSGRATSTYLDPSSLDTLSRRHLRESFKAISRVQERLEGRWVSRRR
ncbi:MAG: putative nucleotidyltransferase substrate binding domain-containing protein [Nocardioides sp.]|uniref:putative nucleotidyltransferase substrate binding domain-containing protein n=1 Tax=Nocardioides sp. TaxID=35761 RepID=UPI0039E32948